MFFIFQNDFNGGRGMKKMIFAIVLLAFAAACATKNGKEVKSLRGDTDMPWQSMILALMITTVLTAMATRIPVPPCPMKAIISIGMAKLLKGFPAFGISAPSAMWDRLIQSHWLIIPLRQNKINC
jgi:hypothetical protein